MKNRTVEIFEKIMNNDKKRCGFDLIFVQQ